LEQTSPPISLDLLPERWGRGRGLEVGGEERTTNPGGAYSKNVWGEKTCPPSNVLVAKTIFPSLMEKEKSLKERGGRCRTTTLRKQRKTLKKGADSNNVKHYHTRVGSEKKKLYGVRKRGGHLSI